MRSQNNQALLLKVPSDYFLSWLVLWSFYFISFVMLNLSQVCMSCLPLQMSLCWPMSLSECQCVLGCSDSWLGIEQCTTTATCAFIVSGFTWPQLTFPYVICQSETQRTSLLLASLTIGVDEPEMQDCVLIHKEVCDLFAFVVECLCLEIPFLKRVWLTKVETLVRHLLEWLSQRVSPNLLKTLLRTYSLNPCMTRQSMS